MTTFAPYTTFGQYRIVGLLGRGGMADVYQAEDARSGQVVALKVLPAEFARDRERARRFAEEIQAAAALDHPSIVPLFDVGEVDGLHYYAMSVLPGGDLKDRLRNGALDPTEAVRITREIASALAYAHEQGFVHRDVKPQNILFRADGGAVLTDFGIAWALGRGTRMTVTGLAVGTPHYMSPEQTRGETVDGRSDLYSLGIVLHEMLTGRVPFDAGENQAIGFLHLRARRPRLARHLRAFQPVLNRLLGVRPKQRPDSAGALLKLLDAINADGASAGSRGPVARSAARPGPGRSAAMAWGLGGAMLGLILIAGMLHFESSARRPMPVGGGAVLSSGAAASSPMSASRPEARSPTDWLSSTSRDDPVATAHPVPAPVPTSAPAPESESALGPAPAAFVDGRYADPQIRATMSRLSALSQSSALIWLPAVSAMEETAELLARASSSSIARHLTEGTAIEPQIEALRVLSSDLHRALDTLDEFPEDLLEIETELVRYRQDPRPENRAPLLESIDRTLIQAARIDSALGVIERSLADMRRRMQRIVERGAQGPIGEAFFRSALDSERKLAEGIEQVGRDRAALHAYLDDVRVLQSRL